MPNSLQSFSPPVGAACRDVLVVGAGLCGLGVAHAVAAARPDLSVTVLEASDRAGGQLRTTTADGYTFEHGATTLTTNRAQTHELVRRLGLEQRMELVGDAGKGSFLYMGGRLHPVPRTPRDLVSSPLLSWKGKLRILAEPVARRRAPARDETVYEFVARRFGDELARIGAMTALQGVTAGDARTTSLPAVAPRLQELDRSVGRSGLVGHMVGAAVRSAGSQARRAGPCTFRDGGLQVLPDTLAAGLGDRVRYGVAVTAIRRTAAGRYAVTTATGERVDAGQVVVAAPAAAAARILEGLAPQAAAEVAAIECASLRVVGLGYRRSAFDSPPRGVGFLAAPHAGAEIIGAIVSSNLFASQAPDDRVLVRAFVGGVFAPAAMGEPTEAAVARVERVLARVYGLREGPEFVRDARWTDRIPQFPQDQMARARRVEHALAGHAGLHLPTTLIAGVGLEETIAAAAAVSDDVITTAGAMR
jgi:oxygen-dependent protoporphyrinogen oxidase